MNLRQVHIEIAKERFLEMMANSCSDAVTTAVIAIEQANEFTKAYENLGIPEVVAISEAKFKGCKCCFGSGGKANNPCKTCYGTGKVPA